MSVLLKHLRLLVFLGIVLFILSGIQTYRVYSEVKPETVKAIRGDVVQQISITGKAKAVQEVDLAFQTGGTIEAVNVRVGSRVTIGDVLATLDKGEMHATLRESEANRDAEAAKLADLQSGARPEDVAILEARVASARADFVDAEYRLSNSFRDAYTSADDAVRNKADQFMDSSGGDFDLRISPPDFELIARIERNREALNPIFPEWARMNSAVVSLEAGGKAAEYLRQVQSYLSELSQAANDSNVTSTLSQTTMSTYKADLSLARVAIDNAIADLQTALAAYRATDAAITVAERTLASEEAGSTKLSLDAQAARVKQFEAQIANVRAQLSRALLISPITGVVTKQNAEVGEVGVAGSPLVSVISDADLEIEAYVPEISIGKVEIGNRVEIVFDAFPDDRFTGSVAAIEPAETVIDGVANFKVTVALVEKDPRLRRGLTADLTIIRASRENVVYLPEFVLERSESGVTVQKMINGKVFAVPITTGMRGENGTTEILSGVAEGDIIVVPFVGAEE